MRDQIEVNRVANLSFATGKVGLRYPLTDEQQTAEFAALQAENIVTITKPNTADCGDERIAVSLGDGTTDKQLLHHRIVPQLFGGIGLATTKALIEADAAVLRGVASMWEAYMIVHDLLTQMGEEDAGHSMCGASKLVELSVKDQINFDILVPSVGLLVPDDNDNAGLLAKNNLTKQQRLNDGFYSAWKSVDHEKFLQKTSPQNFSNLLIDKNDQETQGHNGSGLLVVTTEGFGYRKTGQAFAVTIPKMIELSQRLGDSDKERRRILLGYADDTLHVGRLIVCKDFPVFAQAA